MFTLYSDVVQNVGRRDQISSHISGTEDVNKQIEVNNRNLLRNRTVFSFGTFTLPCLERKGESVWHGGS